MTFRSTILTSSLLIAAGAFSLAGGIGEADAKTKVKTKPAAAKTEPKVELPSGLDTDKDGTVDIKEARAAGEAVFAKLNRDKDETLDKKELKGRLSPDEIKAADPDKDGTLTKSEYLDLVESRFLAAEGDKDKTLDGKEFKTKAGRALLRLIK